MADPGASDFLRLMRGHPLAVVSTVDPSGQPQGALIGVATTDAFDVIFDTVTTSRKHANLLADPRVAVTFADAHETTLQLEGRAWPVSTSAPGDGAYREAYFAAWPDGRARLAWPTLALWRIEPLWLRYSDFAAGPIIAERAFGCR